MKTSTRFLQVAVSILSAITFISCTTVIRPDLYGSPSLEKDATRTVAIFPATRLVTVNDYETIRFVIGKQSFAWRFDPAPRLDQLYLHWIAPENMIDHDVQVIVRTDPAKTDR